jgi:hypothetical protein
MEFSGGPGPGRSGLVRLAERPGDDQGSGQRDSQRETVALVAPAESKNAQQKTVGQIDEKQPGDSGNAQQESGGQTSGQIVGHFPGKISVNASTGGGSRGNAQRFAQQNAQQKIVGQITKKLLGKSGNAQRFSTGRTEWFRYEMDFRDRKKGGHHVIIRRRLKWSANRYAPTIAYCFCGDLTERMVKSIKDGKFTAAAIAALENGGISHEIIKRLLERIGKGNGKRATELTDHERSVLARIESGLAASDGRRNASAGGKRRRLGFPRTDVPNAPDGEFTEVPNVH